MSGHHEHSHSDEHVAARVAALESILIDRGLVDPGLVDAIMQNMADSFGPMNGARVVAHAWADDDFRIQLLRDATSALDEFGMPAGEMAVVENTDDVHNVVVCTLCSCYPWSLLGIPPTWYKSLEYRSNMVREARRTLAEMGTIIPDQVEIRVWDSSAELRYLVIPQRPPGSAGLDEHELAELVTRDSMIGVQTL